MSQVLLLDHIFSLTKKPLTIRIGNLVGPTCRK